MSVAERRVRTITVIVKQELGIGATRPGPRFACGDDLQAINYTGLDGLYYGVLQEISKGFKARQDNVTVV